MNTHRIPGNEPDAHDMSTEPGIAGDAPNPQPGDAELATEEEAARLGDFA